MNQNIQRLSPIALVAPFDKLRSVSTTVEDAAHPLFNAQFASTSGAVDTTGAGQTVTKANFLPQTGLAGDELLLVRAVSVNAFLGFDQAVAGILLIVNSVILKKNVPFYFPHEFGSEPWRVSSTEGATINGFTAHPDVITDLADMNPDDNMFSLFGFGLSGRTTSPSPATELNVQFEVLGRRKTG